MVEGRVVAVLRSVEGLDELDEPWWAVEDVEDVLVVNVQWIGIEYATGMTDRPEELQILSTQLGSRAMVPPKAVSTRRLGKWWSFHPPPTVHRFISRHLATRKPLHY